MNYLLKTSSLVFVLFLTATAYSQTDLEGIILNERTGLPITACHVILIDTHFAAVSDQTGRFFFYGIPPGKYDLKVTHIGLKTEHRWGVIVTAGGQSSMEIQLQPQPVVLPEVSVNSRLKPTQGELSGAVIVDRERLRSSGSVDIARALEREGLVTVSSDGTPGGKQTVTIRGSASDQVLVLLDGKPLNDVSTGIADLSSISLAEISHIEVYHEAPSSLGAQAIGGVINLVTLKPGARQYQLQAGLSSYGEKRAAVTVGENVHSWSILGNIEHKESTGEYRYEIVSDDGIDLYTRNVGETFTRLTADYRRDYFSVKIAPPSWFDLSYRRTILHRNNPDYLPLSLFEHESFTEDDRQDLTLTFSPDTIRFLPAASVKVEGYNQKTKTDYGAQFPLLGSSTQLRGEAYRSYLDWRFSGSGWHDIGFGGGLDLERLWSDQIQEDYAQRFHQFGYLQVQGYPWHEKTLPVKIGIFTGLRADGYDDDEVFITPRLGIEIGKSANLYWSLRAEIAGAYRLPSFNSLFWQEDLQSTGNPDLKPERSYNREISAKMGIAGTEFGVTYFDRDVWDLIYWRLDFDNRWKPLNMSSAYIYGAEITLRKSAVAKSIIPEVHFAYRWLQAINRSGESNTDGNYLPYRPVNTFTLSIRKEIASWVINTTSRWVSRRFTNEANTKSLSPYKVWDIFVSKRFLMFKAKTTLRLQVEVRNVFNEAYRIVDTAPTPLRELWFTIGVETY
ncbi:hypothetical protein CEE37_10905 [candidate division LCP-89 bacterium B3_LCP]|uniref:TonB-dependent receptor plug domain-containing protein n=1 Tax=candidate division LCP-89 bacterium B3_LCP TaxID=2012998 RepID=A0A532UXV5_UNCL8|nr:MAG: hypothetical protein CEE37_10905 [candidate division LCP-89 bacterium B3_LCP]